METCESHENLSSDTGERRRNRRTCVPQLPQAQLTFAYLSLYSHVLQVGHLFHGLEEATIAITMCGLNPCFR